MQKVLLNGTIITPISCNKNIQPLFEVEHLIQKFENLLVVFASNRQFSILANKNSIACVNDTSSRTAYIDKDIIMIITGTEIKFSITTLQGA